MKRIMRPVDIIVWTDDEGGIHPIRFRYADKIVKVDRVMEQGTDKFAGNTLLVFDCLGTYNEKQRRLQLKYEHKTCLWYLDKIE